MILCKAEEARVLGVDFSLGSSLSTATRDWA